MKKIIICVLSFTVFFIKVNATEISKIENIKDDYQEKCISNLNKYYIIIDNINLDTVKSNSNENNNTISKNINLDFEKKYSNNKLINTLKISNDKSIAKYLIIVVITLTIIYIILSNNKEKTKK